MEYIITKVNVKCINLYGSQSRGRREINEVQKMKLLRCSTKEENIDRIHPVCVYEDAGDALKTFFFLFN